MTLNINVRPKARKEVKLATNLDQGTYDCLMEVVEERGCSTAEFLRALILAYLDKAEPC